MARNEKPSFAFFLPGSRILSSVEIGRSPKKRESRQQAQGAKVSG